MNQLQAIPTPHGLSILTSSLKSTIKQFKLLGNTGPESANVYEFYSSTIHASYYDENGVLTFEMRLPIETHFDEYMYRVHIVDDASAVVIECETPKVALPKGIGGMLTLKSTVTGIPGDLVFQNSDFLTETEFMARFASKMQAMPYAPSRTYSTGETCYTKDAKTGELSYWQWYSNVESLAGKNPLAITNRHTDWTDNTKPFYWIPYTGDQVGMPLFWLETEAPEWAVMEINVDLPIAVYWRLARRYPHLINGDTLNTGEIRGEFLRVLAQGRGTDPNRQLNSHQNGSIIAMNDMNDSQVFSGQNVTNGQLNNNALSFDNTTLSGRAGLTGESIRYYAGESTGLLKVDLIPTHSGVARPTNVARPMVIAI